MNVSSSRWSLARISGRPRALLGAGVVLILLLAAFFLLRNGLVGEAQGASGVGYVDWSQVQAAYLEPKLEEPLTTLSQLQEDLQAEFDEKAEEMEEAEKEALFEEYQAQLDQELAQVQELEAGYVDEALTALARQAREQGVDLVLEEGAVLQGGVDLTPGLLKALGVQE